MSQDFTGKERDAETGLDYFGARYFSSAQGRFTSPDKPLADQSAGDPQSWNLYSYVRNNPLRFTDPTGSFMEANPSDPPQSSSGGDIPDAPCGVSMKDCIPGLKPGFSLSQDGRFSLLVDQKGAKVSSDAINLSTNVFDAMVLGGALMKGLEAALGAAAERLGLDVAADSGIALTRGGLEGALADEARVLHAGRHLVEEGLVDGSSNAAVAAGTRTILSQVLSKPVTSFITRVGAGEGEVPVRLFVV